MRAVRDRKTDEESQAGSFPGSGDVEGIWEAVREKKGDGPGRGDRR